MQPKSYLKILIAALIVLFSPHTYADKSDMIIVTCKSVSGHIEVSDTLYHVNTDNPKRHLVFKIYNKYYEFDENQILTSKEVLFFGRADYAGFSFAYYIPNEEINNSSPHKARILMFKKENGKSINDGIGFDAFCTIS